MAEATGRTRGSRRRSLALMVWSAVVFVVVAAISSCGSNASTPSAAATPTVPSIPSPSPAATGPFWVIDATAYPGDPPDLMAAVKALAIRPSTGALFEVNSLFVAGDWAVGWAGVQPFPSAVSSSTETAVVIGHLLGGTWVLTTDRDPTFCAVLAQTPQTIANDDERAYFVGCH